MWTALEIPRIEASGKRCYSRRPRRSCRFPCTPPAPWICSDVPILISFLVWFGKSSIESCPYVALCTYVLTPTILGWQRWAEKDNEHRLEKASTQLHRSIPRLSRGKSGNLRAWSQRHDGVLWTFEHPLCSCIRFITVSWCLIVIGHGITFSQITSRLQVKSHSPCGWGIYIHLYIVRYVRTGAHCSRCTT